jgi:ABC-type uncharacterized transport system ATPase subunit
MGEVALLVVDDNETAVPWHTGEGALAVTTGGGSRLTTIDVVSGPHAPSTMRVTVKGGDPTKT